MTHRHIQSAWQQTTFASLGHFGQRIRTKALGVVLRSELVHETVGNHKPETPKSFVFHRTIVKHFN